MANRLRTISKKMKKSGINGNFLSVLITIFLIHFIFFEFIYLFMDDGGFSTKYWYDFPILTFMSLFISGFITSMVYFGMLFFNTFWKNDDIFSHLIKAIVAEIAFFAVLLGSLWLYFFL